VRENYCVPQWHQRQLFYLIHLSAKNGIVLLSQSTPPGVSQRHHLNFTIINTNKPVPPGDGFTGRRHDEQ
jgi:hypothetical protein